MLKLGSNNNASSGFIVQTHSNYEQHVSDTFFAIVNVNLNADPSMFDSQYFRADGGDTWEQDPLLNSLDSGDQRAAIRGGSREYGIGGKRVLTVMQDAQMEGDGVRLRVSKRINVIVDVGDAAQSENGHVESMALANHYLAAEKPDEQTNISALEVLFRDNFGIDALLSMLESDGDICHKHAKMDIAEPNEDAVAISPQRVYHQPVTWLSR